MEASPGSCLGRDTAHLAWPLVPGQHTGEALLPACHRPCSACTWVLREGELLPSPLGLDLTLQHRSPWNVLPPGQDQG